MYLIDGSAILALLEQYLNGQISRIEVESNIINQLLYYKKLVVPLNREILLTMNNIFINHYGQEKLDEMDQYIHNLEVVINLSINNRSSIDDVTFIKEIKIAYNHTKLLV